jgi:membrane protease YdiL (CAAX protease family)
MTRGEALLSWCYWPFQLLLLPILLDMGNGLLKDPFSEVELNFVFFCVNFLCLTVILNRFLGVSAKSALKRPFFVLRSAVLGLALYFAASWVVGLVVGYFSPDFSNANDSTVSDMLSQSPTLITVGTVILAPVAEELMYRALIFRATYNRSRILGYLVSTLLFGAIHVVGYIGIYTPMELGIAMLQYVPAGLCLGWAYARCGNIYAPILMHITINQLAVLAMR